MGGGGGGCWPSSETLDYRLITNTSCPGGSGGDSVCVWEGCVGTNPALKLSPHF